MTFTEAMIIILGIVLIGLGYTWLYIELRRQIERYAAESEYCPGLEEEDERSED